MCVKVSRVKRPHTKHMFSKTPFERCIICLRIWCCRHI